MLELVSVDEAKQQMRVDDDSYDDWLAIWIPAVSASVAAWLKDDWRLYIPAVDSSGDTIYDSSGDPIPSEEVNPSVKAAVLIEVSSQMRYREGEGDNRMESMGAIVLAGAHGYTLSRGATAILSSLRKPTVR